MIAKWMDRLVQVLDGWSNAFSQVEKTDHRQNSRGNFPVFHIFYLLYIFQALE